MFIFDDFGISRMLMMSTLYFHKAYEKLNLDQWVTTLGTRAAGVIFPMVGYFPIEILIKPEMFFTNRDSLVVGNLA